MTDASRSPDGKAHAAPDGTLKPSAAAGPPERARPALVWPPPEAELAGYEVVQLDDAPDKVSHPAVPPSQAAVDPRTAAALAPAATVVSRLTPPSMLETTDAPLAPVRSTPAALPVPRFGGADAAHGSLMGVDDLPVLLPAARSTEAGVDEVPPSTPLRTWAVAAPLATLVLVVSAVGLVWWRTGPSTAPKTTPPPNAELRIETSSPGAWVLVNGLARGSTPLQLSLAPGKWRLEVGAATERRALDLELAPGSRATYVFDLRTDPPTPTLAPEPPRAPRRRAGAAAQARRRVETPAGDPVATATPVSTGVVSFNATPWAEVWVGGQRLGETPLGNVRLPVGHYDVVFKHPQFGERRAVAVVRASTPERVTVSFER